MEERKWEHFVGFISCGLFRVTDLTMEVGDLNDIVVNDGDVT